MELHFPRNDFYMKDKMLVRIEHTKMNFASFKKLLND